MKDPEPEPIICYLRNETLPEDTKLAKKVVAESSLHAVLNDTYIYFAGPKQTELRIMSCGATADASEDNAGVS